MSEETLQVINFSGQKKDYVYWAEKFMAKANHKGYGSILDGSKTTDTDDVTAKTDADELKVQESNRSKNKITNKNKVLFPARKTRQRSRQGQKLSRKMKFYIN